MFTLVLEQTETIRFPVADSCEDQQNHLNPTIGNNIWYFVQANVSMSIHPHFEVDECWFPGKHKTEEVSNHSPGAAPTYEHNIHVFEAISQSQGCVRVKYMGLEVSHTEDGCYQCIAETLKLELVLYS